MPQPLPPKALISYAHEDTKHDSLVRALADQLRRDRVECELDQYHDAPEQGWPSWMAHHIFDHERSVLVIASPSYLRRWLLAERAGVGLGAKHEGRLIRQVLYSQEGLNGRVIPIVLGPDDTRYLPPELRDTTRYAVHPDSSDIGYDALLRRLVDQPAVEPPPLGAPLQLLDEQEASLASVFYILQQVPAPFPLPILCRTTGIGRASLLAAAQHDPGPPILNHHDGDLLTTTYYRPVRPLPLSTGELLSQALDGLLAHIRQRGPHGTTREDLRNALVLAGTSGARPDLVARVFGIAQSALKRLGDKRLVWRAATLSLAAASRQPRHREDAEAEALALICGQSWVLQRVNRLEKAEAAALDSLALGKKLQWHRNTAFCWKCLGRLNRMRADAAEHSTARQEFLAESERYLLDAIGKFADLDDQDSDDEIGDCYSLLGRTLFAANRFAEAKAAARRAESLLNGSAGKDYHDLQILHGDLAAPNDADAAEGFYSSVIQQCARDDAQYSDIRARAYYARATSRLTSGPKPRAKRDFEAAGEIWKHLQDPALTDAEWGAMKCTKQLPIDPSLLESRSRSSAVRVCAMRIHEESLRSVRGRPARRRASIDARAVDRLIERARTQVGIDEVDWVSRITQNGVL